jgi:hypothetical protein
LQDGLSKKANYEDFRTLVEEKVDVEVVRSHFSQTPKMGEFEQLRRQVERLSHEQDAKFGHGVRDL